MIEIKFVFFLFLIIIMANTSSAATVELINPTSFPTKLHEGDHINFTIKINTLDENINNITIETSLISSGNKPIFDFGDLNPSISENRYSPTITLDTASLPKTFQVSISGNAPAGETRVKVENSNIIYSKFIETKLKFYEVRGDQKLIGIESFELAINSKEKFDNALQQINLQQISGVKREVINLFNLGLTKEAQNIVNEIVKIKLPNDLTLFGILDIKNNFWLNAIMIITIVLFFIIGYYLGSRKDEED